jgi:hypothetical protein
MRVRAVARHLLLALTVCALAPAVVAQTAEEVRDAVSKCIGFAPENKEARERLERWGEAAWPVLRELAEQPSSSANLHLMSSIANLKTREAADLFVDLVERDGRLVASHALNQLFMYSNAEGTRSLLETRRCRAVIIAHARTTMSWLELTRIAEIIGNMGWTDDADVLRGMLEHHDLNVRRAAAAALETLTGEVVEIDEPTTRFPGTELDEELVTLRGPLPDGRGLGRNTVGFLTGQRPWRTRWVRESAPAGFESPLLKGHDHVEASVRWSFAPFEAGPRIHGR